MVVAVVYGNWSDSNCNWSDTQPSTLLYQQTPCSLSHVHTHTHTHTHTHKNMHILTTCTLSVSVSLCCSFIVLFYFAFVLVCWELVKQNNSQYVWSIADFPSTVPVYKMMLILTDNLLVNMNPDHWQTILTEIQTTGHKKVTPMVVPVNPYSLPV